MDTRVRNLNLEITIQKQILVQHSRTSAREIIISAREDGTVNLRGTAEDLTERDSITRTVKATPGVTRVFCNISVKPAAQVS